MCALRERTVGQVARGVFHQPARRPVANGNTKQKNRGVYAPPNIYLLPRPKNGVASNRRLAEAASLRLWIFQSRRGRTRSAVVCGYFIKMGNKFGDVHQRWPHIGPLRNVNDVTLPPARRPVASGNTK